MSSHQDAQPRAHIYSMEVVVGAHMASALELSKDHEVHIKAQSRLLIVSLGILLMMCK